MESCCEIIPSLVERCDLTIVVEKKRHPPQARQPLRKHGNRKLEDMSDEVAALRFIDDADRFRIIGIDDQKPDSAAGLAAYDRRHTPDGVLGARDELDPRSRPQKGNERENSGKIVVLHVSLQTQQVPSSLRNGV